MISGAFDVVTYITIISIAAILTVYILILKRNGWIGKTSNYRCPNPDCKKIFHSPLKVKDYSNKKDTRIACPECGYDLGFPSNQNALMQTIVENIVDQKAKLSSDEIETQVSKTNMQNGKVESININPPVRETTQETTLPQINNEDPEKVTRECKNEFEVELENAEAILSDVQSPVMTERRDKPEEIENDNLDPGKH